MGQADNDFHMLTKYRRAVTKKKKKKKPNIEEKIMTEVQKGLEIDHSLIPCQKLL